ncbi:hypothetical protein POV27_15915 [Aureisphaera galaxeae]|uniref:hypothetical protein n=1 Tax=Aureisphaera galaxeae TaxID=1538023 RepID=UPI00234FD521|nr:hypothetical protein [Aureisphaera galaxeae]MDC8005545.1 hypothetical protein [Aureisphaera galaxeae]
MKSTFFIAIAFLCTTVAFSQGGFRIGLNGGFPAGDEGEFASFVANLEVDHDWAVTDNINVGASAGITVFSGKEEFNDFKYAPLVVSGDITVVDALSLGADVGYGISLEENIDGALIYRFVGRYGITDSLDASARFASFDGDFGTLSNFTFGIGYRF